MKHCLRLVGILLASEVFFAGNALAEKLRDSSFKACLAPALVAQSVFKIEFGEFTTDLIFNRTYTCDGIAVGFVSEFKPSPAVQSNAKNKIMPSRRVLASSGITIEVFDSVGKKRCPDCTASKDSYKLIAVAPKESGKGYYVWTLNNKKEFENLSDLTQ